MRNASLDPHSIPPLSKGRLGGDCNYKRTHAKHYTRQSPPNLPLLGGGIVTHHGHD